MDSFPIEVVACRADEDLNVDASIARLASNLHGAEPDTIRVTGDLMFDLWTLHVYVQKKLEVASDPSLRVTLSRPHEITHEVDSGTGKWIPKKDSVALIYFVQGTTDPTVKGYLGFKASTGAANETL